MHHPTPPALALALALTLLGCSKDEEPPPSGERTKEPIPETPKDAPKGPFAGFDFEAAAAKWQGAWTLSGSSLGRTVAWTIEGKQLIEFDGETEKTYEFAIYSPCQVTYTDAEAGVTTYQTFTFADDKLYAGLGSAGTVVGDAGDSIVACMGGKTYVLRGDECFEWSEMFDDWKSEKAECKLEGEGAARKLVTADGELPFVSDTALANSQMQGNVAVAHGDFAAAKAALPSAAAP
jgi:hypothetical protein